MKRLAIFFFIFANCDSTKTVTFKELISYSSKDGPPPCRTLEEMREKWNGKDSSYGRVIDFKSGPVREVLDGYIWCAYEAEVDSSKY